MGAPIEEPCRHVVGATLPEYGQGFLIHRDDHYVREWLVENLIDSESLRFDYCPNCGEPLQEFFDGLQKDA